MDDDEGEGFEEWDADFLDQAIRVEENALCTPSPSPAAAAASNTLFLPPPSSTSTIPPSSYYLPPQPPPSQFNQSRLFVPPSHINAVASISHSPPRELSQRTVHRSKTSDQYFPPNGAQSTSASFNVGTAQSDGDKEHEIERLKRELRRVSKQLTSQELECTELRKERDKKEAQLKSIVSQTEGKGSGGYNLKGNDGGSREKEILKSDVNIQRNTAVESRSTCKGVGIQTDKSTDSITSSLDDGQLARQNLARKLQSVWIPPFNYKVGSSLVSKLFVGCHALLRCVGADTSKTKSDSMDDGTSCDLDGLGPLQSSTAPDALKVSRLYSVTVKVSDGTAPLEGLLEPLVSLCGCDNVTVVHRSLCILYLVLKHLFITERNFEKRDNIIIKELLEENVAGSEAQKLEFPHAIDFREAYYSSYEHESSGTRAQPGNQLVGSGVASTVSYIDCISLFELLHQIIMKNREQHLRLEAISIMNLILMRSSAYEEREKFGLPIVMESVSELLKKGCGSSIQIQAVHLLFLILNCPKLLEAFSSLDSRNSSSVDDNATAINFQGSAIVLEGLAGCIACCGTDIKDLELRRKVIVLLAFLGSSGNAGFQIMMNHKLENGANFLMLILQALVLELDMEAAEQCESPEVSKERTLLMREALILLNRLVSNPLYSSTSLRVLTKSRDMVSLSIDVANRMSRKPLKSLHINSSKLQGRDAEIVELASSFKRKVFAYLGDGIS